MLLLYVWYSCLVRLSDYHSAMLYVTKCDMCLNKGTYLCIAFVLL